MTASRRKGRGIPRNGSWLRRGHRWLGMIAALFVLGLSVTGIALNHGSGWGLDKHFVTSGWLLDAYGIRAPEISASFVDRGYRATLLGARLYLGEREIAADVDALTGLVSLNSLLVVTSLQHVLLLTNDGELVERMTLPSGPVERVGRSGKHLVVTSAGRTYRADSNISTFRPWENTNAMDIDWSMRSDPPSSLISVLEEQYRGRGLSIERVIADIHSGRIVGIAGPYVMDAVAILLIILSLTGLLLWFRPRGARRT